MPSSTVWDTATPPHLQTLIQAQCIALQSPEGRLGLFPTRDARKLHPAENKISGISVNRENMPIRSQTKRIAHSLDFIKIIEVSRLFKYMAMRIISLG